MWVWSDELVERVSTAGAAHERIRVPLVAYAVIPGTDLDELALEVLSGSRSDAAEPRLVLRERSGR